jgi:hypothetical protein
LGLRTRDKPAAGVARDERFSSRTAAAIAPVDQAAVGVHGKHRGLMSALSEHPLDGCRFTIA